MALPRGYHLSVVVLRVPDVWDSARRAERLSGGIEDVGERVLGEALVVVEAWRSRICKSPEDDTA